MVKLHIMFEGGVYGLGKDNSVAYNTPALREALHSFFCKLLDNEDISIVVSMECGYRNAIKSFVNAADGVKLFVDSDTPKSQIENWFKKVETENPNVPLIISENKRQDIYFMIQEMEAWFLKQPNCFEAWAAEEGWTRRASSGFGPVGDYKHISGKNIEDISKPSAVTAVLLKHFFERRVGTQKRKLATYGKLTTAPILLNKLDVSLLKQQDSELQRFEKNIQSFISSSRSE